MKRILIRHRYTSLRVCMTYVVFILAAMCPAEVWSEESGAGRWRFKWGPHASVNIFGAEDWTRMREHDTEKIGLGVTAGMVARYVYNNHWYLSSGLLLSYGNSPVEVRTMPQSQDYHKCHIERGAVHLPIHAGYRICLDDTGNLALSFFTGTTLSCGFAGSFESGGSRPVNLYGSTGIWRRFDAAWDIGATFEFSKFMVEVCGNLGVVDMARQHIFRDRHMYECACRIGFTYWLPTNKTHQQ